MMQLKQVSLLELKVSSFCNKNALRQQAIKQQTQKYKHKAITTCSTYHTENDGQFDNNNQQKCEYIDKFTINLTTNAKKGKYDKIIGRDKELKDIHQVLLKRTKKNPLIVGDAGVGKTALVEELARSIIYDKQINTDLQDCEIIQLDITSIMSGTKMRGELENNITNLLKELLELEKTILFIDEIHSLVIGDKSSINVQSYGNGINIFDILKPPLSRGQITVIGSTTYEEYAKYFKNDAALERRFQVIDIEEPSVEKTLEMMYQIKGGYEEYHKCMIMDTAIKKSIQLANIYLPYRKFPDKAIDLIDEACSKVVIESFKEKRHIKIVDTVDIENVMSMINGINIDNINLSEMDKMNAVENSLKLNVIGQPKAVSTVMNTLKRRSIGIHDKNRPICSMLFVGPTGVGKTSLCKMIANEYYGDDKKLIRFDMSEYMEDFSVSSLIGAPPGYVGYDEGGKLTNAVKQNPCSIILFDEIEKAHPEVFNVLLQVLEDGVLTDALKRTYSFKNTIIVMTSNAYQESKNVNMILNDDDDQNKRKSQDIKKELLCYFKPEFLNRIDEIVVFDPLTHEDLVYICDIFIKEASNMIYEKNKINVDISKETYESIIDHVMKNNTKDGARPIKRIIEQFVINPVTDYILTNENTNVSYIYL
jgi:ATP-dependent Clp protease ATP-binding subunit ClpA